jgi:uncharacterized protein YecE (DUF72 family)
MAIFIGTSGWAYREWRGVFYPPRLQPDEQLAHYVTQFTAVEINGTAYRTPDSATVRRWRETMPPGFIAALKLSHGVTHFHRLRETGALLEDFVISARLLGERLGPLLAQLPPGFAPDHACLRDFLAEARAVMADPSWPLVIEFRHPGWIDERTAEILTQAHATWCVADMPVCPVTRPPSDLGVLYLRRHGTAGKYCGSYSDEALLADARLLCAWSGRNADAFAFFNNTADGAAIRDARRLQELVDECQRPPQRMAERSQGDRP